MPVFNNALAGAAGSAGGAAAGFKIERSLRFNNNDSAYLNRTPSSSGNRKTWTWSCWIKRSGLADRQEIFAAGSDGTDFFFDTDDKLHFYYYKNSAYQGWCKTDSVFRDASAWYHIVLVFDSTQGTASGRVKIYVNNVLQPLTFNNNFTQDDQADINNTVGHYIGRYSNGNTEFADYYLADVHFIDGLALAPTNFGEFDADTGVWNPIEYTGNFNASGSGTMYSGMLTSSSGFLSGYEAENAFDGSLSTSAWNTNNYDNYMEFTPTTPINFTNGVQVHCYAANGYDITNYWSVDLDGNGLGSETSFTGGAAGFNGHAWIDVATGSGTLHKLRIRLTRAGSGSGVEIKAIAINGSGSSSNYLVDGTPAGVNGFHLDFSDNSSNAALGTDSSGNSNTWTVNNLTSVVANNTDGVNNVSNITQLEEDNIVLSTNITNLHSVLNSSEFQDADTDQTTHGIRVGEADKRFGIKWSGLTGLTGISLRWQRASTYDADVKVTGTGITETTTTLTSSRVKTTFSTTSTSGELLMEDVTTGSTNGFQLRSIEFDGYGLVTYPTNVENFTFPGADQDSLLDSPTNYEASSGNGGNYATLNPLATVSGLTLSNGNLDATGNVVQGCSLSTIFPSSGKYYAEFTLNTYHADTAVGVVSTDVDYNQDWVGEQAYTVGYLADGRLFQNSSATNIGAYAAGDIIGIAFDVDTGKIWFSKNGTFINSGDPGAGTNELKTITGGKPLGIAFRGVGAGAGSFNFGQRPFSISSVPTGFKSLCTQNLDDPLIADGSDYFDTVLYDGDGTSPRSITLPIAGDLLWMKARNDTASHQLVDTVRGNNAVLLSNSNNEERNLTTQSVGGGISSLSGTTAVITAGTGSNDNLNENNKNYVAWTWDGGDLATNSAYNQSQTWSGGLVSSTGSYYSGEPATNLFDGDISTSANPSSGSGSSLTFTPPSTLSYTSSVEIYTGGSGTYSFNGGASTSHSATTWTTIASGSGTISSIVVTGSNYPAWRAIRVDGKILVDAGVIPVGSLNSSVYNTSSTWRSNWTASGNGFGSNPVSKIFDANLDNYMNNDAGGQYITWNTTSYTLSGELLIDVSSSSGVYDIYVNGSKAADTSSSRGWVNCGTFADINEIQFAGTSYGTSDNLGNAGVNVYGIKVGGKQLIDSDVTPPNVPSIATTVRANPSAGFSIVSFTGNGANSSVAHGLNATPEFIITKDRDASTGWPIWGPGFSAGDFISFSTLTKTSNNNYFPSVPTSSVVNLGPWTSPSGNNMIAYCFTSVEGYSKFGTYVGTGVSPNFVYLGFRPAFVIIKSTTANDWVIYDSTRDPYNLISDGIFPEQSSAEVDNASNYGIDFLSNGFALRTTGSYTATTNNASEGHTYIYGAWAENPFKYARAR